MGTRGGSLILFDLWLQRFGVGTGTANAVDAGKRKMRIKFSSVRISRYFAVETRPMSYERNSQFRQIALVQHDESGDECMQPFRMRKRVLSRLFATYGAPERVITWGRLPRQDHIRHVILLVRHSIT
jgi:hypothetical protein